MCVNKDRDQNAARGSVRWAVTPSVDREGSAPRTPLDARWAGSCQQSPQGDETQGIFYWVCFDFERYFSAVFIIASDGSFVYVLLSSMAGEVCIPGRREEGALGKCHREDSV